MSIVLQSLGDFFKFPRHRTPVLTRLKYTKYPTVGMAAPLSIKSRNAENANLKVTQAGVTICDIGGPPCFITTIRPVSTADLTLTVTLEPLTASRDVVDSIDHQLVLPVRQHPPRLRIRAPWFVRCGENGLLGWNSPAANEVALEIDDGVDVRRRVGPPLTAFFHRFGKQGKCIIRFLAKNDHSLAPAIRTVRVLAPRAPHIKVEDRVQCGRPGTNVSFSWKVENAVDEVWIEELSRNQTHKVEAVDTFVVQITSVAEEFLLMARGPGGTTRVRLRATPWIGLESPNQ